MRINSLHDVVKFTLVFKIIPEVDIYPISRGSKSSLKIYLIKVLLHTQKKVLK